MTNLISKLTKLVMIPAVSIMLNGCSEYTKKEQSKILYEKGKVVTTLYNQKNTNYTKAELGKGFWEVVGIIALLTLGEGLYELNKKQKNK